MEKQRQPIKFVTAFAAIPAVPALGTGRAAGVRAFLLQATGGE